MALMVVPGVAAAQDVDNGRSIARTWCSNCHTVERAPEGARADGLPSFVDIASRPQITAQTLRAAMTVEHGRMPNFSVSNAEMRDLAAYILSLRK